MPRPMAVGMRLPSLLCAAGRRPRWLALATALAAIAAPATAQAAGYQNPFTGEQPYVGRTDMGVDVCLTPGQPIQAVGDGVVVGIERNWFEHQPYIFYELTDGPDAGRYVYVAEQITRLASVGQTLQAGDTVARYARKGTCIETGWSAANGATLAQSTTGYSEGQATTAGVSFARFLISLGVPGNFDLVATKPASAQSARRRRHRRHQSTRPAAPTAIVVQPVPTTPPPVIQPAAPAATPAPAQTSGSAAWSAWSGGLVDPGAAGGPWWH